MYDFYFGTPEEIAAKQDQFLIFIKRMLPRWCNSIPDSEYLAIHNSLRLVSQEPNPVIVETGVGASTIVLLNHVMKHDGVLYSWDLNATKGAFLRSVFTDTLVLHYGKNIFDHWKFISYSSNSDHLGVRILKELKLSPIFAFFDSDHTLDVLLREVSEVSDCLKENSIVALDDANYTYRHTNVSYINMQRKKIGLPPIKDIPGNECDPFYAEIEKYLKSRWTAVEYLKDSYKTDYKNDIFWAYFRSDREALGKEGMEKFESLEHRYDTWRVSGRKAL